jgi:hypothetical protein
MTIEEFDKTGFTGNMKCEYKGKEYDIQIVDFEERLIAICENGDISDPETYLDWKRCENIKLL